MKKILTNDNLLDAACIALILFFFGIAFAACLMRVG